MTGPETWDAVDAFITGALLDPDPALDANLAAAAAAGLPTIAVAPNQGKLLHLLAKASGASRILEVGTLGGYSTTWLARALPEGGRLVTLELDPAHAAVARANLDAAGVGAAVEVRVGPAADTLRGMVAAGEGPYDFVFIDADKEGYPEYFALAVELSRPGTVIVADNVVRGGAVADPGSDNPRVRGVQRMFEVVAADPRVTATGCRPSAPRAMTASSSPSSSLPDHPSGSPAAGATMPLSRGCSSARQSASFATKKSWVQIPSPPQRKHPASQGAPAILISACEPSQPAFGRGLLTGHRYLAALGWGFTAADRIGWRRR